MHGRRTRRTSPLGNAPFTGIAALAIVLALVIVAWAGWQIRDSQEASAAVERESRGLAFISDTFSSLVDWGGLGDIDPKPAAERLQLDIARLERTAAALSDIPEASAGAAGVRDAWLQARGSGQGPDSALVGEALLSAMAKVADGSGLAFESDAEANDLGDALDNPLALEFERLNAAYGAARVRARLEAAWRDAQRSARELRSRLAAIARGDREDALGPAVASTHQRLTTKAKAFAEGLSATVARLLDERRQRLARDRVAIIAQLFLGLILCFGMAFVIGRGVISRQRRALFRAQRDSAAEQFRTIFERSPMGIGLLDRNGDIVESNAGLGAMLDSPSARVIVAGDPEYAALADGKLALYRFEQHWTRDDGRSLWAEVTVSPVVGRRFGPVVAIAMLQDVTERRASDATLRYAATHDALTALPNRAEFIRCLNDVLAGEAGASGRYAVLFIDLDGFKAVNDRLGHLAGDRVIEVAAQRLRKASRASDFVARFHGDEFGLLLVNVDGLRVASAVADRIQEEVRAPIVVDGEITRVAPSIGIVLGHPRYTTADEILRDADSAMYQAKARGGACAVEFEYREAS